MNNPTIVIPPREKDVGGGFNVRRVLPWAKRKSVGPFVFWDHMGPTLLKNGDELQVRAHPHIGLSTLTYLFEGCIRHRDTLGITQDIKPGAINWMTAGKGIAHSERTHPEMGTNITLHGIQVWIALPKEAEEMEPSFVHIPESDVPHFTLDGHPAKLIAGEFEGLNSPVPIQSPLFYIDVSLVNDKKCSVTLPAGNECALYVAIGEIELEGKSYACGEMIVWDETEKITFSTKNQARVLIFGGLPFPEKRHVWWNLVSSRQDRIEQAKKDWRAGKFGKVIDEEEYIPMPES